MLNYINAGAWHRIQIADADQLDRLGGNIGIIVIKGKREGYIRALGTLMCTMGSIGKDTNYIVQIFHRNDVLTKEKVESVLAKDGLEGKNVSWHGDTPTIMRVNVLYDESGIYDDVAMFKSHEFKQVPWFSKNGNVKAYLPELHLEGTHMTPERAEELQDYVREAFCSELLNGPLFNFPKEDTSVEFYRNLVSGISCRKMTLPMEQDDLETFLSRDYRDDDGVSLKDVTTLVRNGNLQPRAEDAPLCDVSLKIRDLMNIWDKACAYCKVPLALSWSEKDGEVDADMLAQIAGMIGMGAYVESYLQGVPMEDMF